MRLAKMRNRTARHCDVEGGDQGRRVGCADEGLCAPRGGHNDRKSRMVTEASERGLRGKSPPSVVGKIGVHHCVCPGNTTARIVGHSRKSVGVLLVVSAARAGGALDQREYPSHETWAAAEGPEPSRIETSPNAAPASTTQRPYTRTCRNRDVHVCPPVYCPST